MLLRLTPEQIGNLNGYIYTVARNALTQEFTKRDLERKALETIFREYPQLLMGSEPPPSDEIILFQQRLTVVNESLDLLTDKEKLVFEQRRAGQTLAQIAEMTGMALSTVSTHLQRALTKIRDNSPPDTQE